MTAYTGDDVTAAAKALHPEAWDCDWNVSVFSGKDQAAAQQHALADAEAVLAAVAPAIRESGYQDGESNVEADYMAAFDEWPEMHYREDVDEFARKVAARALREAADMVVTEAPWDTQRTGERFAQWLRARAEKEEA